MYKDFKFIQVLLFIDCESKIPQPPRSRFRRGEISFRANEYEENMEEDLSTLKFFDLMVCYKNLIK